MPLENIQNRLLQVTVWSHDSLQENEFLGGVELNMGQLDLREEYIKWFPLGYVTRSWRKFTNNKKSTINSKLDGHSHMSTLILINLYTSFIR